MNLIFKYRLHILGFYALLAYPLFYFVYKHINLDLGYKNFTQYVKLYSGWDFSHVDAPYNMRLISSYIVYLMTRLNIFYPSDATFDVYFLSAHKVAFFNAILLNYISLVFCCFVLFRLVLARTADKIAALFSGVFLLLGFGTVFYLLAPLTDCFSVFLLALVLYYYEKRSFWLIPLFIVSIFQREYIFICFSVLAGMDFLKTKNRFYVVTFVAAILSFVIYVILRKTVFHSELYANQLSLSKSLAAFADALGLWKSIIMQLFLTMNIAIIYLGVICYKKYRKMTWDHFALYKIALLFVVTNIIGFASMVGNNAGRIFYLCIPIIIYYLAIESKALLSGSYNERA